MASRWSNRVTKHGELSRRDESLDMLLSSARARQEEASSTPLREKQKAGGESPKESSPVHTPVPKSTPHTCHSQVSSALPTQETLEGDSSFVNSHRHSQQKLGGSLRHISRTGMDSGDTAQESQAGICWPMLCYPSLQHYRALSMCPGISATKRAQIPLEDSL